VTPTRIFDLLAWGAFIGVGALQMAHVHAGFVTNYGADVVCPALLYVLVRRRKMIPFNLLHVRPRPLAAAACILIPCFVWEILQRYDLSGTPLAITRGHFDPLDLAAYAIGVAVVAVPDLLSMRHTQETDQVSQIATIFAPSPRTTR
jgi:hypothetical protein